MAKIAYDKALKWAKRLFVNLADAEDICQVAYYEYLQSENDSKRTLYNKFIDAARQLDPLKYDKRLLTEVQKQDLSELADFPEDVEELFSYEDEGPKEVEIQDLLESLHIEPNDLTIISYRREGYSQKEISEMLGIDQATVSRRLSILYELIKKRIYNEE